MEFVRVIESILNDVRTWIVSLIGAITIVRILVLAVKHQAGDAMEKEQSMREIKKCITMCGGCFFVVLFVTYLISKMRGLA